MDSIPSGPGGGLLLALQACIADPGKRNRDALEEAERNWAQVTGSDLVWEAYRIALNGIPLGNLEDHLRARLSRLRSAFREAECVP